MKKVIKTSLLVLSLSILFSGCMEDKVSKVSPNLEDKNSTKTSKQAIKTLESISKLEILQDNQNSNNSTTLIPNRNKNDLKLDSTLLDELAVTIQNSMDMDILGNEELTTESLEIGENWVAFTKKDEILETAKEYLGIPYIWAANGPSAFDCSGFTKYVFKKNGITIPRYSGYQANVGVKILFDELEKGDLVFFDTTKGFHQKVNHVGIYIGNNQFIHASSAQKKVVISSFSEKKFYRNRFLHGRRLIDTDTSFATYNGSQQVYSD